VPDCLSAVAQTFSARLRNAIGLICDLVNEDLRLTRMRQVEDCFQRDGLDLVASGVLLEQLTLPPGVAATRCGELALRGKEAPVAAYGLTGA